MVWQSVATYLAGQAIINGPIQEKGVVVVDGASFGVHHTKRSHDQRFWPVGIHR